MKGRIRYVCKTIHLLMRVVKEARRALHTYIAFLAICPQEQSLAVVLVQFLDFISQKNCLSRLGQVSLIFNSSCLLGNFYLCENTVLYCNIPTYKMHLFSLQRYPFFQSIKTSLAGPLQSFFGTFERFQQLNQNFLCNKSFRKLASKIQTEIHIANISFKYV